MEVPSEAILALLNSCTCFGMLDRFIYWLALGAIAVSRHLPRAVCLVFGQCVGALLWAILPRYRKLARENLSAAFGNEKSPREIRRMTYAAPAHERRHKPSHRCLRARDRLTDVR
jgi:hypothetical protein